MTLRFKYTNESLEAIIAGLDLKEDDRVLSIAGSGDQAFAILEFAESVHAVDISKHQVDFMNGRIEALKRGDYEAFLDERTRRISQSESETDYFRKAGRLQRIQNKLSGLSVKRSNIFRAGKRGEFSKIYLSNSFYYYHSKTNPFFALYKISRSMPVNGLIYVSNHDKIKDMSQSKDFGRYLPPGLSLDFDRSFLARMHETEHNNDTSVQCWLPGVYRRV